MSKFKMWWALKGEEKTKKIIGRTCKTLCIVCALFLIWGFIIGSIIEYGWAAVGWWVVGILFTLIVAAAIFWGDKVKNE